MPRLTDKQDAFGHLLLDYHDGYEALDIAERDDGFIDLDCGADVYFMDYGDWPEHQRRGMRHVRGRVLDVGCGAGRVPLHLQGRGHAVTAIDNSPLAVEVCRKRGVRDVRLMSVTQVSRALGTFDTVVMYGNNFGLLGGERRARWLLRRFAAMTSPGARIVAETRDPYETEDSYHLAYHELNRQRGRMPGQVRIRIRYKTHCTPWFDYLFASREEVRALAEGTGWEVEQFIGTQGDPMYIAVLRKV